MRTASFFYVSENQFRCTPSNSAGVCLQNTYDYSPFGVSLDGRTLESDFYRRGFNGMEKDDDFKGEGNSYSTEFRQMDPRLGRWLSLDPLMAMFSSQSSYVAFDNNPIYFNDPNGAESKSNGDPPGLPAKKTESDGNQRDWQEGDDFKDANGDTWVLLPKGENSTQWQRDVIVVITKNAAKINNETITNVTPKTKFEESLISETPWMDTALKEKEAGVKEEPKGSNSGPKVDIYLKYANVPLNGVPNDKQWCAAFVHWCLGQNGIKGAGAGGKSYKKWGDKLDAPRYGAIAIFKSGHVGFYMGTNPDGTLKILHGNWSHAVTISSGKFDPIYPSQIDCYVFPKNK